MVTLKIIVCEVQGKEYVRITLQRVTMIDFVCNVNIRTMNQARCEDEAERTLY